MSQPKPSKPNVFLIALLVVAGVTAIWLSFHYDDSVRSAVVDAQDKHFKKSDEFHFYAMVRVYGDWPWLVAYGAVGLLAAWKLKSREWALILAAAILASSVAGALALTSRVVTGRTRPKETPKIAEGFYGPWKDSKLTITDDRFHSFPSCHTAAAFGFAGAIFYGNPWLGTATLVLASVIGWSSIATGNHHPSDVAVSTILGLIIAWFTWRWMQKYGPRGWHWLRRKLKRNPV